MTTIEEIKLARDELAEASKEKCTCSGFYLQYEGSCGCEKGKHVLECNKKLNGLIRRIE